MRFSFASIASCSIFVGRNEFMQCPRSRHDHGYEASTKRFLHGCTSWTQGITSTRQRCRRRKSKKEALSVSPLPHYPINGLRARRSFGRREYYSVVGAAIAVGEHAADRMIAVHVHAHGVATPQVAPDRENDACAHNDLPGAVANVGLPG